MSAAPHIGLAIRGPLSVFFSATQEASACVGTTREMSAFTGSSCAAEFKILRSRMKMGGKKERYTVKQGGDRRPAAPPRCACSLPRRGSMGRGCGPARRCLSARRCAATRGSARRGRGTHRAISRDGPLRPVAPRCAPLRPAAPRCAPLHSVATRCVPTQRYARCALPLGKPKERCLLASSRAVLSRRSHRSFWVRVSFAPGGFGGIFLAGNLCPALYRQRKTIKRSEEGGAWTISKANRRRQNTTTSTHI